MIIVIGAGPAGLAAAEAAARNGADVTLIDAAPRLGGQYWRHRDQVSGYQSNRAEKIFAQLLSYTSVTHISGAHVWSAERMGELIRINYLQGGFERSLTAEKIILATGAFDRTLPFPGWESSGSMTPGAAQAMLKEQGVLVGNRVIVAGTGPFLLPVATGLARAGADVVGVFEAQNPLRWALSLLALLRNISKFAELRYYASQIRKYKIRIHFGKAVIGFSNSIAEVAKVNSDLTLKDKERESFACDVVAVGWGFTPEMTLGGILGCAQEVGADKTVSFIVDEQQLSSQKNIWIAGEATGIGGADLSLIEGEIAGLSATGQKIPLKLIRNRSAKSAFAKALLRSYPVGEGWKRWLTAETIVCRCEEVSFGDICASVSELGAEDSRTAKLFTRAGMGLCQGRVCSRNVAEIVAARIGCVVADGERVASSNRPTASPISLGQLADGKNFN